LSFFSWYSVSHPVHGFEANQLDEFGTFSALGHPDCARAGLACQSTSALTFGSIGLGAPARIVPEAGAGANMTNVLRFQQNPEDISTRILNNYNGFSDETADSAPGSVNGLEAQSE